jgi:prepilin-type N-terminal cleavage/methylation domain-containing protein
MTAICRKVSKAMMPLKTSRVLRPAGAGFTLVEMMVTVAIIAVAAVGALDYQYYAAQQSRIAQTQIVATRTAQLLLEDWKSTGGSTAYNPVNLQLGFSSAVIPVDFGMGLALGSILNSSIYTITVNDVSMLIILGWSDVATDATSGTTLRRLNVMVRWMQQGGLCNSPVILTTYVRLDG